MAFHHHPFSGQRSDAAERGGQFVGVALIRSINRPSSSSGIFAAASA
jgi:hypothetical protein